MAIIWWLNHHAAKPENQISAQNYSLAKSLCKFEIKTIITTGTHDHNRGYRFPEFKFNIILRH